MNKSLVYKIYWMNKDKIAKIIFQIWLRRSCEDRAKIAIEIFKDHAKIVAKIMRRSLAKIISKRKKITKKSHTKTMRNSSEDRAKIFAELGKFLVRSSHFFEISMKSQKKYEIWKNIKFEKFSKKKNEIWKNFQRKYKKNMKFEKFLRK